jgi:membrane protease YdiL (CAAX protease family)
MGYVAAAILSSLLFGIFHLNVPQGVSVFFLGIALAWLYERSDSLLPAMALHIATNLFGQGLIYLLPLLNIPIQ